MPLEAWGKQGKRENGEGKKSGRPRRSVQAKADCEGQSRLRRVKAVCEAEVTWEEAGAAEGSQTDRAGDRFTLERIPWVKEGYYYSGSRPGKHPYHGAGALLYPGASRHGRGGIIRPRPGGVCWICAQRQREEKSSHIASRMKGSGFLLSSEIHPARARIPFPRTWRGMGVRNAVVSNEGCPKPWPGDILTIFHKIVVDAPCSGEKGCSARDRTPEASGVRSM